MWSGVLLDFYHKQVLILSLKTVLKFVHICQHKYMPMTCAYICVHICIYKSVICIKVSVVHGSSADKASIIVGYHVSLLILLLCPLSTR